MKNLSIVGIWNRLDKKFSFVNFNSFKDAKIYVKNNFAKSLFEIETDYKTTFIIYPKF